MYLIIKSAKFWRENLFKTFFLYFSFFLSSPKLENLWTENLFTWYSSKFYRLFELVLLEGWELLNYWTIFDIASHFKWGICVPQYFHCFSFLFLSSYYRSVDALIYFGPMALLYQLTQEYFLFHNSPKKLLLFWFSAFSMSKYTDDIWILLTMRFYRWPSSK